MVSHGYARAYHAQSVLTASPGQLVLMMFDGALRFLALAKEGFNQPEENVRRFETINLNLQRAQNIIAELQGSLNYEAGGEIVGEDYVFCDRAREAGFRIWCDAALSLEIAHLGQQVCRVPGAPAA